MKSEKIVEINVPETEFEEFLEPEKIQQELKILTLLHVQKL